MSLPPCKNCKLRRLGCHADCEPYKAYRAEREKEYAERERMATVNWYQAHTAARRKRVQMEAKNFKARKKK